MEYTYVRGQAAWKQVQQIIITSLNSEIACRKVGIDQRDIGHCSDK